MQRTALLTVDTSGRTVPPFALETRSRKPEDYFGCRAIVTKRLHKWLRE